MAILFLYQKELPVIIQLATYNIKFTGEITMQTENYDKLLINASTIIAIMGLIPLEKKKDKSKENVLETDEHGNKILFEIEEIKS